MSTASEEAREFYLAQNQDTGAQPGKGLSFAWPRADFAPFLAFAFSVDYVSPRAKVPVVFMFIFPVYSESSVSPPKAPNELCVIEWVNEWLEYAKLDQWSREEGLTEPWFLPAPSLDPAISLQHFSENQRFKR